MFTSQPTNQRTISRFKLYPYGWLSPIPFEKNKTDGAAFDNVHFWRTACHHMPPKVRATARANMPMCPSKLSFLFKLLMDTETHLSVSCCDFFFKFHGKKKHEETWSLSPGGYLISIIILSFEFEKTSAAMSGCYKLVLTPHSSHLAAPGFFVRIFSNHCLPNRYRCF